MRNLTIPTILQAQIRLWRLGSALRDGDGQAEADWPSEDVQTRQVERRSGRCSAAADSPPPAVVSGDGRLRGRGGGVSDDVCSKLSRANRRPLKATTAWQLLSGTRQLSGSVAAVQVNIGASAAIRCRKQKERLPRRERLLSDLNHDLW